MTDKKEFNVVLKRQQPFSATVKDRQKFNQSVLTGVFRSNNSFKGEFEKVIDLNEITAFEGDYADVFETQTRWEYNGGRWVDTYEPILVNPLITDYIDKKLEELQTHKVYIKEFAKSDFKKLGEDNRYVLSIKKEEHKLVNPYVLKMLVESDGLTTCTYEDKSLSTGTVKIYVTINLDEIQEYSGKIYLNGE